MGHLSISDFNLPHAWAILSPHHEAKNYIFDSDLYESHLEDRIWNKREVQFPPSQ
jgi:hypothetical protein